MRISVINDLHLGVQRTGGTTPDSAARLRNYATGQFQRLLEQARSNHVVVNGDMFDTFSVPLADLMDAYEVVANWLEGDKARRLTLIAGNHDLSKNSAVVGSLQLLAFVLSGRFPARVDYLQGALWVAEGVFAISHVLNQDLFDLELSRVPDNAKYLLLHCNFDNEFAGASDHSLNLTREQAKALTKRGVTIILGHEHQGRTTLGDKLVVVGNQFPTSISDCLAHGDGQKDGTKYMLEIDGEDMELVPTWTRRAKEGGYVEVDWQSLDVGNADFIRVAGSATSAQAADVIKAISKLRQKINAFVITNAVKIDGAEGLQEIEASVEDIRAVNVIEMLMEALDPDQQAVVRRLLAEDAQ